MQLSEFFAGSGAVFGQGAQIADLISGRRRLSSDFADEADELQKLGAEGVLELLQTPPPLPKGGKQAPQVLVNGVREQVDESVLKAPGAVLVNVYHLNEGLSAANTAMSFSSDVVTLGGAFHAAVEVYGGEWTFGGYGVSCIPPRSEEAHVYKCSIYMGRTNLDREQLAPVLFELAEQWSGASYDLLGRNCCSFAAELCSRLSVGELPQWVDRFARMLHSSREAGVAAVNAIRHARSVTSKLVRDATLFSPWGAEKEAVVRKVRSDPGPARPSLPGVVGGA